VALCRCQHRLVARTVRAVGRANDVEEIWPTFLLAVQASGKAWLFSHNWRANRFVHPSIQCGRRCMRMETEHVHAFRATNDRRTWPSNTRAVRTTLLYSFAFWHHHRWVSSFVSRRYIQARSLAACACLSTPPPLFLSHHRRRLCLAS
jgi:hypothetical protein